MVSRYGFAALVLVAALASAASPRTVQAASAPRAAAPPTPPASPPSAPAPPAHESPSSPQISQDAAARARMHECAHQWSSIKKAGTAGATTWKEFSATCLVVSR